MGLGTIGVLRLWSRVFQFYSMVLGCAIGVDVGFRIALPNLRKTSILNRCQRGIRDKFPRPAIGFQNVFQDGCGLVAIGVFVAGLLDHFGDF